MSDSMPSPQHPAESSSSTVTVHQNADEVDITVPRVTVKLKKPVTDKKVKWSTETVDNENLGKKKSKCCCIYNKPRNFGESSSSDSSDDECEHCQGHVEKKKTSPQPTCSGEGTTTQTIPPEPSIPTHSE